MLPASRAMALVSCLAGDDDAPLDLVPEPWRTEAREARERLNAQDRLRRAATLARESIECFRVPAPHQARRPLPRGLAIALAPLDPPPPSGPLPPWVERAVGALSSIGVLSLARAASASGPSAMAELARRLGQDGARALIEARRSPADPALLERSRRLVASAMDEPGADDIARRVGLFRLAWALTADRDGGALAAAGSLLPEGDSHTLEEAATVLCFLGAHEAAAERDAVLADLERAP
ncbi:MAG: hypothetical protein HYY06_26000 [Deltaproteobacteria bacterium]|nr:hypothetical protein [Deltaproteobacteria bacterium]